MEKEIFEIGDVVVVQKLQFKQKQNPWLVSGITGVVTDNNCDTCNKSGYRRLEILFTQLGKSARLYDCEIKRVSNMESDCGQIFDCKGEINMNEKSYGFVNTFKGIVTENFRKMAKNEKQIIISKDKVYCEFEKFKSKVSDIMNSECPDKKFDFVMNSVYTSKTDELFKEIDSKLEKKLSKLNQLCQSVLVTLEMCGNFEECCDVLVNYGFMNVDYTLNEEFDIEVE